jgi:hypothetical protein
MWLREGLLEEARSIAKLKLADILMNGVNDPTGTCVQDCGWSSKYAYAYLKLLKAHELWPADLGRQSIAHVITKAETIPDPVPLEASQSCIFSFNHSVPKYSMHRQREMTALDSMIGLCLHCIKSRSDNASRCQTSY